MATTKTEKLQKVHAEALAAFEKAYSSVSAEREICVEDRRFATIPGAQWEGTLGEQFANKPRFEVNKVHLAQIKIINDYRSNRVTTDFVSKDGKNADDLADTLDGLYRSDEVDCSADEADDNAFEEAVSGGFGAWRLRTVYEDDQDEDNQHQRIVMEPIYDADTCVYFDQDAKRQDKRDAKWGMVITSMSPESFEEKYGETPASWPKPEVASVFDWSGPANVYVAELYKVEETTKEIQIWRNILGDEEKHAAKEFEADEGLEARLIATGSTFLRSRKVKDQRVRKYIMSGASILEDCGYIAGKRIPIVPVYGKRWMIGGIERCMGHVRLAKDAQRLANMQRSKLGEISASSVVSKPIFHPEQMAGLSHYWADDNVKVYPYMLINPMTDASGAPVPSGPIGYTKSPEIPPAMAALLQITEQDLRDVLGNADSVDTNPQNVSGKALEMIQTRIDAQAFIYMSNFAKAKKCEGEIWLSMAQEIYVEEGREMKTVNKDGKTSTVILSRPVVGEDGENKTENDIANAKFSISVQVGPASATKKAATVRALSGMMQITDDPETKAILGSMSMLNMEGEGIADVRAYFRRKLVRAQVVKPTPEESQEMAQEAAQQGRSAQDQYLQALAQESSANAQRSQVDALLKGAQAQQTKVKTAQIAQEIQQGMNKQALDILEQFTPPVPEAPQVSVVRVANNPTQAYGIGPATE